MNTVDLIVTEAEKIVTCASHTGPLRSPEVGNLDFIENGAIAVADGSIVAIGPTAEIESLYHSNEVIDARGHAVCPGFVDPHTHVVFGGDRAAEFEMRIQGATYMEIMAAGGGILNTVRATRETATDDLYSAAYARLTEMLEMGSTTVEIKTGYGLDTETELKMLHAMEMLDENHACDIIPTFLGAHTVPAEFRGNADDYASLVIGEMIPEVAAWYRESSFQSKGRPLYIDVFCEDHAFSVPQSRRVLESGLAAGMRSKIHVDQFNDLGGLDMALDVGVDSVDHLDVTGPESIGRLAESEAIAIPLPAVNFNLGMEKYADARLMIDRGAAVALATDNNPGSAPCPSMPMVMAIACRFQKMLPVEAIHAATVNAAHAIGMGHVVGSLQVGKQADILVLKQSDYRHLSYFFGGSPIDVVIKKGKVISS